MSAQILITVPKYVAISPSPAPRNLQPSAIVPTSDGSDCPRAKKRRLDHLTWEEKLQRKKLKNRVAAQTSRDRKKARMEDMEHTIDLLTEKTEILQNKCDSLQAINESLLNKNHKLDSKVEQLQLELDELRKQQQQQQQQQQQTTTEPAFVRSNNVDCAPKLKNGSAVSTDPLPKGLLGTKSTLHDRKDNSAALWKIIALCLLYKTCSKISMPASLKSSPKAYSQISQQTWKEAIQQAARLLPKARAQRSDCLDQWWGPQQNSWNPAEISCTA